MCKINDAESEHPETEEALKYFENLPLLFVNKTAL
jgi:hypothetical protein